MFGQFAHFSFAPAGNDYSEPLSDRSGRASTRCWKSGSAQCLTLAAPDYSIADIATFPWTAQPRSPRRANGTTTRPRALVQRDRRAPGGEGAIAKVDGIKSSRETAKAEDMDRFFGRGQYART